MGVTEELLMSMADEVSEDSTAYLTIDPDTRKISVPSSENTFGVMTDKDSERKYFRCPRIVGDNLDLSQHKIYISYVSTISNVVNTFPDADGKYWCDDVAVDGDYITFSWKLSGNVFKTPGFVAFKVLACTNDGDINKTRWNTAPAYGTILMTVPDGDDIAEQYPDVINQIIAKLEAIEEAGGSGYTLPVATNEKLGGVKPVTKTDEMTQEVGVDADGRMYTAPGGATVSEWAQQPEKPTYTADEVGAVKAPSSNGTSGQILQTNGDGTTQWVNKPSGSTSTGGITEEIDPTVPDWAKQPTKPTYTADEVGAEPNGTATSKVSEHNTSDKAHADIRELITNLSNDKVFNTVDDMISDMSLKAGDYVSTLGYYAKFDGGGADYLISESNNLEPDVNTKYVYITLNNGLYAVLQNNDLCKWVNVLQAGLPRTFGQPDWDKIRPQNIAVTYFFPSGAYKITENISMGITGARDNGVGATLVGESFNQSLDTGSTVRRTVIDCTAVTSGACFKWGGGAHIRDMVFVHTNGFIFTEDRRAYDTNHTADKPFAVNMTDAESGNGVIGVKSGYDNVIECCTFYGFSGYGVYCTGLVRFINNKVVQCNTGIWTGTDSIVTHNSFKACYTCALVASMTNVSKNRVDSCYYFAKIPGSLCIITDNNIDWAWLNGIYVYAGGNDNVITGNTGRMAICAFTESESLEDRYAYRVLGTGNRIQAIMHISNITDGNVPDSEFSGKCIYTTKPGNILDIVFGGHPIDTKSALDTIIYTSATLSDVFRYNNIDYLMRGYSSSDVDMSNVIANSFGGTEISNGTVLIPTICNRIVNGNVTEISGTSGVYTLDSDNSNVSNHVFGITEPCNVAIKNIGSADISGGALQIRDFDSLTSVVTQTQDKNDVVVAVGEIIKTTYDQPMYTYPALRMTAGNYKLKVVFYTGTLSDTELEKMLA